jgi:protein-S-isoprenylcysteine O-methyltransferase Ste14
MRAALDAFRTLVYMSGFVWFWGWVARSVRAHDRNLGIGLPDWTRAFAIPLMVIGAIVALICAGTFVFVGRGTPAPFDAPREFVAVGPYKYVRNPMYIGALIVLFGFGLYLHSVSVLLLPFAVFLLVHLFVVLYEEPNLRSRFGPSYEDYCRRVSRWIPRLPPAQSE